MGKRTTKNITLGSGKAYIAEFDATKGIPAPTDICKDDNLLGYIQGGAELSYTVEPYEEKDDLGLASKIIVTSEEAILKLGILTWNGTTLTKLVDRCKVTDETSGQRKIQIGGAGNAQGKDWVVCFFHEDKKDGNLWVLMRGANSAGFTLTFAVDAGTKIEPEFKALPSDNNGTLITLIEETDTTSAGT